MSQTPMPPETMQGYAPPSVTQFSVFLDMRVGKMLELLEVFEAQALTLAGVSVIDSTDHAVVRVVTSRAELARRLLQRHQLPYSEVDVLVVELTDNCSLDSLCVTLLNPELNIHYMYPLMVRPRGNCAMVIHTDDNVMAGHILRRRHFTLLGENDLGENATGSDPQRDN
jgi:hypothetical protein